MQDFRFQIARQYHLVRRSPQSYFVQTDFGLGILRNNPLLRDVLDDVFAKCVLKYRRRCSTFQADLKSPVL
jgi:hypothetical protein